MSEEASTSEEKSTFRLNFAINNEIIQVFSLNWPHWSDTVIELPCPCVCLFVCLRHQVQFFLGLSLALRSHDQF